jgi:hypothetical protein
MRSFLRSVGLVVAAIVLASCAGYQPPGTMFIRADGQDVVAEQLAADRNGCIDAGNKLESCMASKGYALVRDDEVAAKQKEFAEIAEQKKQEQAALEAAEKKKQAALRRAAARKKKPKSKTTAPSPAAVQSAHDVAKPASTEAVPRAANSQASPWPQSTSSSQTAPWPQR